MSTVNNRQRLPSLVTGKDEQVFHLKQKIQDLETQCAGYKTRLDGLRKAKNSLIIKKTTEYVKSSVPAFENNQRPESGVEEEEKQAQAPIIDPEICMEHERLITILQAELSESKNLVAALKCENEETKIASDKTKKAYQLELTEAVSKQEEAQREVKNWEVMYSDWMKIMEERVGNINQTHGMLQVD